MFVYSFWIFLLLFIFHVCVIFICFVLYWCLLVPGWFFFRMEQTVFGISCTGLGRLDSESTEAQHWGIDRRLFLLESGTCDGKKNVFLLPGEVWVCMPVCFIKVCCYITSSQIGFLHSCYYNFKWNPIWHDVHIEETFVRRLPFFSLKWDLFSNVLCTMRSPNRKQYFHCFGKYSNFTTRRCTGL